MPYLGNFLALFHTVTQEKLLDLGLDLVHCICMYYLVDLALGLVHCLCAVL